MLAPYASNPFKLGDRLYHVDNRKYSNEFRLDCTKIIYSKSFRRLQYKTQVFVLNNESDHYRNRLTHSLEVSIVARFIAANLDLSTDLAEAIALAHDLGHAPFGHAGEFALDACMKKYGGFSHNEHALKILTKLENVSSAYQGMNLTWDVLEGVVKHNGPIITDVPNYIKEYNELQNLDLESYSSPEAQISSLADDISYIYHDLQDSLSLGFLTIDDLSNIDFFSSNIKKIKKSGNFDSSIIFSDLVIMLKDFLIKDLLEQTNKNLKTEQILTIDDIRSLNYSIVDFSSYGKELVSNIKDFLYNKVYQSYQLVSFNFKAEKIIRTLFEIYTENIKLLPFDWYNISYIDDINYRARIVANYIAGMTDRFAIQAYKKLYFCDLDNILNN